MTNQRTDEARKVVSRYASSQNTTLSDDDWELIVKTEKEKVGTLTLLTKMN